MVYGGNNTAANIGVRIKNQLFYTILGVGSFDQNLHDKFSISTSYRAGLAVPVYKGLSISGDLGYQHIETCSNKDEVIPRRLYALQARANLEYQISKKFSIFATGGYGLTRYYNKSGSCYLETYLSVIQTTVRRKNLFFVTTEEEILRQAQNDRYLCS